MHNKTKEEWIEGLYILMAKLSDAVNDREKSVMGVDRAEAQEKVYVIKDEFEVFVSSLLSKQKQEIIDENTSDGYHTFKELYEFRKVYNAVLFNEWAKQGKYSVHKSKKHSNGDDCFDGGWFIVVATLPDGDISNHYELKDWDLFECEERETAKEWDGHTSKDVIDRLNNIKNK